MYQTGAGFAIARANRTAKYDAKVKPVVIELLEYGYGNTALANALNAKGILTVTGNEYKAHSVKDLLKRLELI